MTTEILVAPNANHHKIVEEERKKFSSEWITIPEVSYKGYRFDLMAINTSTKEIKIVEADIAHATPPEKIAFIESFATLKIVQLKSSSHIKSKSFSPLMKTLSSKVRLAILDYLADEGKKTYTELMQVLRMTPSKDAGRFAYHLKYLLKYELISVIESKFYVITEKGQQIIDFCRKIL